MQWIECVRWNGSSYGVGTISETGFRAELPMSELHYMSFTSWHKIRRLKLQTDFTTWQKVSARTFIEGIGFPDETTSGQDVYAFEADGKVFHIPAVVLMRCMFRPLKNMVKHLFRPQSLDSFLVATPESDLPVGFFGSAQAELGVVLSRAGGLLDALSWMYCFPSARRMWDSVLEHGRTGCLGLSLPSATGTIVVRAVLYAGTWLVLDAVVSSLQADEAPFEFAAQHERTIDFHQGARQGGYCCTAAPKSIDIPSRSGEWRLSDREWTILQDLVKNKRAMRHDLRSIIDAILEKFGRGIAWRFLDCYGANKPAVLAWYQKILKDGRWDKIVAVIRDLRSQNQSAPV